MGPGLCNNRNILSEKSEVLIPMWPSFARLRDRRISAPRAQQKSIPVHPSFDVPSMCSSATGVFGGRFLWHVGAASISVGV
jgi:hypothetical protein